MFCTNCGKEIESGTIYCSECGSRQNNEVSENSVNVEWYYIKNNTQQGPYSMDYIVSEISTGNITRESFVWQKGMQNWLPAHQTSLSQMINVLVPNLPDSIIDNRFVWALATIPIFVSWFIGAIFGMQALTMIITIILNVLFITLDIKVVKNTGKNAESWLWLGIVLVPIYLFIRASKTDKNYGYGIVWCVMFLLSMAL